MRVFTIGGYGFDEPSFLGALEAADVDLFVDVRQRAGMRGARYAFLNKSRLQESLSRTGKEYRHISRLAPSTDIRSLQKVEDTAKGVLKRERTELSQAFVEAYQNEVLTTFEEELEEFVDSLQDVESMAFFCVEESPEACHRSLIAARVAEYFGVAVEDLRPCDA